MSPSTLALIGAIVAEVIGTSALNASASFTKLWPSIIVVLGYGTSFYLLSVALQTIPVGVAYAVWAGLGIVLIVIIAWLIFGQALNLASLIGIALIVAGVIILQLYGSGKAHG